VKMIVRKHDYEKLKNIIYFYLNRFRELKSKEKKMML